MAPASSPPASQRNYTVAIVDDHELVAEGIRSTVERIGPYQVTASARSGEELGRYFQRLGAPDLCLVDMRMPQEDGPQVIQRLKPLHPATKWIAISIDSDMHWIRQAEVAGAVTFVHKNIRSGRLQGVLGEVVAKGYHISDEQKSAFATWEGWMNQPPPVVDGITIPAREWELVVHLFRDGDVPDAIIAERMKVSHSRVRKLFDWYRDHFDRHSRAGVMSWVAQQGLVSRAVSEGLLWLRKNDPVAGVHLH